MSSPHIIGAGIGIAAVAVTGVLVGTHHIRSAAPAKVVSAAVVQAARSTNWSGYVVARSGITSASSDWIVPDITGSTPGSSSDTSVVIDGWNSQRILQVGTNQNATATGDTYSAFWEVSEGALTNQVPILSGTLNGANLSTFTVNPGDLMVGELAQCTTMPADWCVTLKDITSGEAFTVQTPYAGFFAEADFIEEAPLINGKVAPLANFGVTNFDGASVNGGNANLAASEEVNMVSQQNGKVIAKASGPDDDVNGFNIAYRG